MDRNLKTIIWPSLVILIFGGIKGLIVLWDSVVQFFHMFFPLFMKAGKIALEDYLTSPYFIVGIIMAVASGFGIWLGAKRGRNLFLIVSTICEILSLVSIGANVL